MPPMSMIAYNMSRKSDKQVALWLFFIAFLVALMVIVGGLTRLTDSGLSITEWQPIIGAIPPLSADDWQLAFAKYKQIPEYQLINKGMSLADFKVIFWWEWAHRFLGRLVGLAFFMPLLWFWGRGQISSRQKWQLSGLLLLGGVQGFMGWYMVQSGLSERVDVSQYRLAAHLGLALLIFVLVFGMALSLWRTQARETAIRQGETAGLAKLLLGLIFIQSLLGALVAGSKAGLTYNDWPLMAGEIIPSGLFIMQPFYVNFFENHTLVQFNHRIVAYLIFILAVYNHFRSYRQSAKLAVISRALSYMIYIQALLGIITLIYIVPLWAAIFHQLGAVICLALSITYVKSNKI